MGGEEQGGGRAATARARAPPGTCHPAPPRRGAPRPPPQGPPHLAGAVGREPRAGPASRSATPPPTDTHAVRPPVSSPRR